MSRRNKGEWEGNGGRKRERAIEGGRGGGKQCVKEREGECEWAGSRCRCAESCSFFPISFTESSESRLHVGIQRRFLLHVHVSPPGKMYERHRRRYSFCAKGERAVDVVLIKVGLRNVPHCKLLVLV